MSLRRITYRYAVDPDNVAFIELDPTIDESGTPLKDTFDMWIYLRKGSKSYLRIPELNSVKIETILEKLYVK
jgi:hypothetical protein